VLAFDRVTHSMSDFSHSEVPMKRGLLLIAALAALGAAWYAFRPERLFVNEVVSEPAATEAMASAMPVSGMAATNDNDYAAANTSVPRELASGKFHSGSHETAGMAVIQELPGGRRVLRFTGFHTSNGPDVQVLLVAANDATDNATVTQAGFVHVGALKGNIGDQNYELPAKVDLAKYRAVTIWCRRFGVNFGTAPLMSHS
jgi:hypothetical protein